MFQLKFLLLSILFSVVILAQPTFAGNIFTIKSVEISGSGNNARAAKQAAITDGQRRAFNLLTDRILSDFSKTLLPEIGDEQLSRMVAGLDIKREKITAKHYEGFVNISFNPAFIDKLMTESGISYIKTPSKPFIILPVLYKDDGYVLWESHPWKSAWNDASLESSLINFKVLKQTEQNLLDINIDEIISGNISEATDAGLKNIMSRYKADKILLAGARLVSGESKNSLDVALSYIGSGYSEHTIRKFSSESNEDIQDLMKRAAIDISQSIEQKWKVHQESLQIQKMKISVVVPFENLPEWSNLKSEIKAFEFLDLVEIKQITVNYANIDLHFNNSYQSMVELFAENNIYLRDDDGQLLLQKLDAAPDWFLEKEKEQYYEF